MTARRDYRALIPRMVQAIVERFDPLQVILFGSYARGDYDEDSDIDFLVVLPEERVPDDRTRRRLAVEIGVMLADFAVPNDVLVTTPSELTEYGERIGYVFLPAVEEGKAVYDRSNSL
jgi:uncharacterized protein